ncbi:MAG: preprotein translocase subunit SecG [Longimicrobiales bacterium]|nr:preprotein translocase subunit SecG [Longimicrobiales bacterium]
MYGLLLALLVLDGVFLGVVILLQSGKGGGLAAMGGGASTMTEGILGGRQATTMLTRATWAAGTLFMVLALILSILSSRSAQPDSVIRDGLQPTQQQGAPAAAPEPVLPGAGEEPAATPEPVAPPTGGDGGGNP